MEIVIREPGSHSRNEIKKTISLFIGREYLSMNYEDIPVEDEVNAVIAAAEQKKLRPATKRESMSVRLAALSDIVHELQMIVKNDKELSSSLLRFSAESHKYSRT
jgi:hypothetical protein